MLEHERAPRRTELWSNQVEPDELVEGRRHFGSLLHDQCEELGRESTPQDRCRGQRIARQLGEPVDAGDDDPFHGRWHVHVDVTSVVPDGSIAHQRTGVLERANELLDEERIARGRVDDAFHQWLWKHILAHERGQQRQVSASAERPDPYHLHVERRELLGPRQETERR